VVFYYILKTERCTETRQFWRIIINKCSRMLQYNINSSSVCQETPRLLWESGVRYHVHKNTSLVLTLSQTNLVTAVTLRFSKAHFVLWYIINFPPNKRTAVADSLCTYLPVIYVETLPGTHATQRRVNCSHDSLCSGPDSNRAPPDTGQKCNRLSWLALWFSV
jgi:hypothetical protein